MMHTDPYSGLEILPPVGDELKCRAVLLQTIHATLDPCSYQGVYVEPGRDIMLSYPIEPGTVYTEIGMEDYFEYEFEGGHHYRRLPNGSLVERLSSDEPDHAYAMDVVALQNYHFSRFSVLALDANKNIYGQHSRQYHWIHVYNSDKKPLAKFRMLGFPVVWYIAGDGCLCSITNNMGLHKNKRYCKNLLRIYRLELPSKKS